MRSRRVRRSSRPSWTGRRSSFQWSFRGRRRPAWTNKAAVSSELKLPVGEVLRSCVREWAVFASVRKWQEGNANGLPVSLYVVIPFGVGVVTLRTVCTAKTVYYLPETSMLTQGKKPCLLPIV